MLGAFRDFLAEVEAEYPSSYEAGDYDLMVDMFEGLTNETSDAGVRISDMAVDLARRPPDLIERLYFLEVLAFDLRRLGSPEAVCARCLP